MTTFELLPLEILTLVIFKNDRKDMINVLSLNKSFYLLSKQEYYQRLFVNRLRILSSISGFIDRNGYFKIKSPFSTPEGIIDGGRLAHTYQRSELIDFCWKIYIPLSDQNVSTPNRERIIQFIWSQLRNNDAINFSNYKLKCYYQWLRLTQSQLSDLLQKYLT